MRHHELVNKYAARLGVTTEVAHHLVGQLCEEILCQLSLGEDVRLAGLGKFVATTPSLKCHVSNLPAMKGKISAPKARKRVKFKAFDSANTRLSSGQSFLTRLLGTAPVKTRVMEKARKEATVARAKKGEHCTVDVPAGVRQITINLPEGPAKKKRKKRGTGESGDSKKTLLG